LVKISTARHTLRSLFLARESGKVADPCSNARNPFIATNQVLRSYRISVSPSYYNVGIISSSKCMKYKI